jgi:hypothetical protein
VSDGRCSNRAKSAAGRRASWKKDKLQKTKDHPLRESTPDERESSSMDQQMLYVGTTALQGLYYLASGAWPLISLRTFENLTGPKADKWLVQTFGLLICVVGLVLLVSAFRAHPNWEGLILGIGSALTLAAADSYFVARRVISPVYLIDAAIEVVLLGAWAAFFFQ